MSAKHRLAAVFKIRKPINAQPNSEIQFAMHSLASVDTSLSA